MTWKFLWALRKLPSDDPLYWHLVAGDWAAPTPYHAGPISHSVIWLILAGLLYLSMCGRGTVNMWIITLFSLLAGSVYGLIVVYQVSSKITEAKARAVYDFLCLAPSGPWRVNWALCTGALHRYNALRAILILVTFSTLFTSLHLLSIIFKGFESTTVAEMWSIVLLSMMAIPILLFTDYAQSLVIASLIGIMAPTYYSKRVEARLVGIAGFLILQIGAYLLWILLVIVSAKGVNVDHAGWIVVLMVAAMIVSIVRELVVVILNRILARRFDYSL